MRKKIVAGNWKMYLNAEEAQTLVSELTSRCRNIIPASVEVILAPSFVHLCSIHQQIQNEPGFFLCAQNLHEAIQGAYTGEVSASMLKSVGCTHVIIGHSERRQYFGEKDALLANKTNQALNHNLIPIFCIGETLETREAGDTFSLIKNQLTEELFHLSAEEIKLVIIAYEPVWAIGTGKTASPEQAQEVHAFIRELLSEKYGADLSNNISLLYGGSVNPGNAQALFACKDIDGALVGGASLKATDFTEIIKAR